MSMAVCIMRVMVVIRAQKRHAPERGAAVSADDVGSIQEIDAAATVRRTMRCEEKFQRPV